MHENIYIRLALRRKIGRLQIRERVSARRWALEGSTTKTDLTNIALTCWLIRGQDRRAADDAMTSAQVRLVIWRRRLRV